MPDFSNPVGSTQRYIAALNRNQADRVPATKKIYADHAAFLLGLEAERECVEMGIPVWFDGIDLRIQSEPLAVIRRWLLAPAADDCHGRQVVIGPFATVLPSDDSRVRATSGEPASGIGANGDLALDEQTGVVYQRQVGSWSVRAALFGGSAIDPEPEPLAGALLLNGNRLLLNGMPLILSA